jgi:hypothetical protein
MTFRFRRSIRILPGIRLNLGKRGVSTSIGVRGAHVTLGHGQVRETVGIPGTGVSYMHVDGHPATTPMPEVDRRQIDGATGLGRRHWPWVSVLVLAGLVWFLVHLLLTHRGLP